ncbi:FAD-dependent oxidoreductase [bacterium]|nr:MAG: FAD-dependent oxidoreductase [bacterium]
MMRRMGKAAWDVVVVGGGPGGAAAANLLAARGRRVLVLEAERFPRPHIGESLLPGVNALFERLGVMERLKKERFWFKTGGSFLWGRDAHPWSTHFVQKAEVFGYAVDERATWTWHVDRPRFDAILLDAARRRGARVEHGARVTGVDAAGGRVRSLTVRGEDGAERRVFAKLFIDASGQAAVLAGALGGRRPDPQLRSSALGAYFTGARFFTGALASRVFLEALPDGVALWCALAGGRLAVHVLFDSDELPSARRDPEAFFRRKLARTKEVGPRLRRARRTGGFLLTEGYSQRSLRLAAPNAYLVGDAAGYVDPILTTGVLNALLSGTLAADCAHAALSDPARAAELAAHYAAVHGRRLDDLRDLTMLYYDENRARRGRFWRRRATADHAANRFALFAHTYRIPGHRHWESPMLRGYFRRWFDHLGPPAAVRRDPRFRAAAEAQRAVDLAWIDDPLLSPPGVPA